MEELLDNDYCILTHLESSFFHVHYKNKLLDLNNYKKILEVAQNMYAKHGKVFVLYTSEIKFNIDKETWNYMRKNIQSFSFIGANAMVISSLSMRMMTKLYLFINGDSTPSKVFPSYDEAYLWLKKIKN